MLCSQSIRHLDGSRLISQVGASEEHLAAVCAEARRKAPCIVVMDEMQALFGSRDLGNETHATVCKRCRF